MKYTFKWTEDSCPIRSFESADIHVGDEVLVYSRTDDLTGCTEWFLSREFANGGYPGIMNPSIRRYHGWRGTYNNTRTEAHGVYRIDAIERSYRTTKWGREPVDTIRLNHKDLRKGEE